MSAAESFGEKRNSFVLPLTKIRRKLIISTGTGLDMLMPGGGWGSSSEEEEEDDEGDPRYYIQIPGLYVESWCVVGPGWGRCRLWAPSGGAGCVPFPLLRCEVVGGGG